MDTIKMNTGKTQMVAHAGLMGMETANTNAGFIAAGNRTYWGIECDVRVAKDGLAVLHNPTTAGMAHLVLRRQRPDGKPKGCWLFPWLQNNHQILCDAINPICLSTQEPQKTQV